MVPDSVVPIVKHGKGSVMVWGYFSGNGTGDLVQIEAIMKKEQYKLFLEQNAIPSEMNLVSNGFIVQQGSDTKHSSKLCIGYLEHKESEGTYIEEHDMAI